MPLNLLENLHGGSERRESIEDSRATSSLLTYREIFMNCFSENITLNAGQHEKAKTKSFSDIYTTKTTLKKFNFYVRENRQQGEEEIVADAILGSGYVVQSTKKRNKDASRRKKKNSSKFIWASDSLVNSMLKLSNFQRKVSLSIRKAFKSTELF